MTWALAGFAPVTIRPSVCVKASQGPGGLTSIPRGSEMFFRVSRSRWKRVVSSRLMLVRFRTVMSVNAERGNSLLSSPLYFRCRKHALQHVKLPEAEAGPWPMERPVALVCLVTFNYANCWRRKADLGTSSMLSQAISSFSSLGISRGIPSRGNNV